VTSVSVQFGRWNFDGQPINKEYLTKVGSLLAPFGPDGSNSCCQNNLALLHHAFHTTTESHREVQPYVSRLGAIITWDGRLDNRSALIGEFAPLLTSNATDIDIVAAAYDKWGNKCFARLLGDWALALWNPNDHSLVLAKDPIGVRHLYYCFDESQITWSTILDPLILLAGKSFSICEEYLAGWLSYFPAAHLTPYVGIHSVRPSSFVRVRAGVCEVQTYWDFDSSKRVYHRTDSEYEEHFRAVFGEAVRRRLRSDSPILAELSGGMDSSSIVCMADTIIARGMAQTPRLDTVSDYDDSEPNWNERPYIAKVESHRGRGGCHIDISSFNPFTLQCKANHFAALPSSATVACEHDLKFAECLTQQRNRVVFSGVGGDEFTGGVPSPIPDLADALARAKFRALSCTLKAWALERRVPWFHLLFEAVREFLPSKTTRPVSWLKGEFAKRFRVALSPCLSRSRLFGSLPSFQQSMKALDLLRGQLGCYALSSDPVCERCYPYLDRDFIEFSIGIPREQMVRPGQRRSLMRRALAGITPDEILNRKRKAFVVRGPLNSISTEWQCLLTLRQGMRADSLGIVDSQGFLRALKEASCGQAVPVVPLMRTIAMERWLRSLDHWDCPSLDTIRDRASSAEILIDQGHPNAPIAPEGQALS
jgi:asparagine synthase (glutamine-hydrolysing)